MRFIDLFCGIGGFHQALKSLGHECVFACDIDKHAISTYEENYGLTVTTDITKVEATDVPKHEILCGGFPCQAFSLGGHRLGFNDPTKGTLFFHIARILKEHKTPYIFLENVKNLVSHDEGKTWSVIKKTLIELGYQITQEPLVLSPHQFGTPQLRERVYILGKYNPAHATEPLLISDLPYETCKSIDSIMEATADVKYNISAYEQDVLDTWEEFFQGIKHNKIGFPIWVDSFKATLDPSAKIPKWKMVAIQKNIDLYKSNKSFIDKWLSKHDNLDRFTNKAHRRFEWQAGKSIDSIWKGIIQFRQSGIRVKKPNHFQTLVAIVQTPIYGPLKRRLTVREVARLQDFPDDFIINKNERQAYKQFGNGVNVKVIKMLAQRLTQ